MLAMHSFLSFSELSLARVARLCTLESQQPGKAAGSQLLK
jgi:hypothetical protein